MYEVMPESTKEVLALRVSGRLDKADYAHLHPWLHERLAENPCPAILVVMEDLHGWDSAGALIEDARLDIAHQNDVRRIAMVGERAWQKWMTLITIPFAKAEIRYFDLAELGVARAWARSGSPGR